MLATFINSEAQEFTVEVEAGSSLMRAATTNGIPGIIADCGGTAACATCHVYVNEDYVDRLPPCSDNEDQMLDCTAADRMPNSRLSCQIIMKEELDGIRVTIADPQL